MYTMRANDAATFDHRNSIFVTMSHNKGGFPTSIAAFTLTPTGHLHSLKPSKELLSSTCFRHHNCGSSRNSTKDKQNKPRLYKISLFCVTFLLCLRETLFAESSSINIESPPVISAQSTAKFATSHHQGRISARSLVTSHSQVSNSQQHQHQQKQDESSKNSTTTKAAGCFQPIASYSNLESSGIWTQNQLTGDHSSSEYQNHSFGFTQSRVSNFVKPIFYTLRLKVDPTKRKFSGQLMITLDVNPPNLEESSRLISGVTAASSSENDSSNSTTLRDKNGELGYRYLTLHSGGNINIKKAFYVFNSKNSVQIPATKIGKDVNNELLTIDFYPNVITSGQGLLLIVYTGNVNETDSQGLFVHHSQKAAKRQFTSDDSGLATHMQPNFARRLMPAWDEPHFKARFNLIVVLPFRGYQSISNMPIKRRSISLSCSGESLQEIEFQTTPTMSTYLLTLVIGRFDYIESISPNNCKIRVYVYSNQTKVEKSKLTINQAQQQQTRHQESFGNGKPNQTNLNFKKQAAQMALQVAVETFDSFETLLGVKYPLNKFDMIALREFDNGGMENWGASIFHENYILYDNSTQRYLPSFSQDIQVNGGKIYRPRRLVVPLVVAHEIAHQWFGNLLTSHSWTYLWLNEGFAQLLMYEVANSLFPNENYWHIFTEDNRQSAMHEDELRSSSRALEFELDSTVAARGNDNNDSSSSYSESSPAFADSNGTRPQTLEENYSAARQNLVSFSPANLPPAPGTSEQLNLFDQLTYNKGAMIVRMVYYLLGRKQFFAGLQHYLLKHSYGTVTSHDLWSALEESTGRADMQLESQMVNWLRQEGYPVINVQVFEEPFNYKLLLTQERFQLLNDSLNNSINTKPWSIPISVSSELCPKPSEEQLILKVDSSSKSKLNLMNEEQNLSNHHYGSCSFVNFLLAEKQATVSIPKSSVGAWLKLNSNATGYFRVNYVNNSAPIANDLPQTASSGNQSNNNKRRQATSFHQIDMLARMASAVKDKSMCVIDRFNLVDDLFAMVKSGKKQTSYYLRYLIEAFSEETEIIVLRAIVESLRHIKLAIVSNSESDVQKLSDSTTSDSNPNPNQNQNQNSNSNSESNFINSKFMSHYERYVQNYLRKLSQNIMRSVESVGSELAPGEDASHHQVKLQLQLRELKGSEDLIGAHQIQHNEAEMLKRAADLFSRHFRQPATKQLSSAFDSMDRELRASIYSAALMGTATATAAKSNNEQDSLDSAAMANSALNDELSGTAAEPAATLLRNSPPHVTTRQPNQENSSLADSASSLSSIFATFSASHSAVPNSPPFSLLKSSSLPHLDQSSSDPPSSVLSQAANSSLASFMPQAGAAPSNNPSQQPLERNSVFLKLLKAYETSDSSNERYAICSALGSVEQASKQIELLNLTLFQNYFRPHDAISILDSLAKTKQGRKLIFEMLKANTKTLEKRQLLVPILRSLSLGLVETTELENGQQQQDVETFLSSLHQLYGEEYGKLISQTIEIIRINTQWFRQDHDLLLKYLTSSSSSSPGIFQIS